MSNSDRDAAAARRKARLIEHIKAGKTVGEICDLEGLDPANEPKRMRREVADPEGLTITAGRNLEPPAGLEDVERFRRNNLGNELRLLRDQHHFIEVAHLVGMTNIEQQRALDVKRPLHNWTLAQIQRLATARGRTFEEMLTIMNTPFASDMRNIR